MTSPVYPLMNKDLKKDRKTDLRNLKDFVNLPPLRFPEFRDTEGWTYMNGDKVFDTISNKNHNSDLPILAITQENGAIPRDEINYSVIVTDKSVESYKVVEIGDFIISLRTFQGGIEYSNYKGICSPAYIILRKKIDIVEDFFKIYFKTVLFIKDLNKNIEGIRDGKMVSYKQFSELLLPTPSVLEQQKIASCLTSLDELITAQSQKLDALKVHKKGLMQQLFPADGETVPPLRFKEWRDTEGWEYMNGNEVFDTISNKNHNSDLPILAITQENGAIPRDEINYSVIVTDKSVESYKVVEIGDFIISLRSFQGGIEYSNYKGICSPAYIILRKKIDVVDSFFKIYFKTVSFIQDLNKNIEGIRDGKMVSYKQFSDLLLPVPKPEEQQKIADCLSSLDDVITAESEQLAALKGHKKGLMQKLFPNTNDDVEE